MPDLRPIELDELVNRPGTYFNPQTEVVLIVDDSPTIDAEIVDLEEHDGAEWVLVSDEVPVDERARDELLEAFQAHLHAGPATGEDEDEGAADDDELEPDEETE